MVGDPKSLHDPRLHRVEAQIRVTCRSCQATEIWEVSDLANEVSSNGGNPDWRAARSTIKCPRRCASPRIDLVVVPFGKRRARKRAHRHPLVNLALQILRDAAQRSAREQVGTVEVRLALHVLRPIIDDQRLLRDYWSAAVREHVHPWGSCHQPYRWIVTRLIELGAEVDTCNRP